MVNKCSHKHLINGQGFFKKGFSLFFKIAILLELHSLRDQR